jgi:ubiquinone/menaquinone biosynthesis C-methylase UbiE
MTDQVGGFHASSHFDQLSNKYDDLIGLVTGDIGRHTIDYLIPTPSSDSIIHDNACGTGLVTEHLQHIASKTGSYPKLIHATDFVPSVTQVMRRKASGNGWKNVDISVMDSQELTFPDNHFDLSITNFGIFFLPDPQQGANHIYRTLKPGGTAVVTTWKERRSMETIAEAQKSIRPDLKALHSPWAEHWAKEKSLRDVLTSAGFAPENVKIVEKRTDAIMDPFLRDPDMVARAYPAAVEGWTVEDKARLGGEMLRIAKAKDPQGSGAGGLCLVAYIAIAKK